MSHRTFLLLDANVVAGYYLPRSLNSKRACSRIETLLDFARSGRSQFFLYLPNFCIAEVFSVFMKYALSKWNRHVKKKGLGTLDRRVYESLVRQFEKDIHNGQFINQYELSRYHVLGINFVAPIDHYFQISRAGRTPKTRRRLPSPMGSFDHLLISMGVQLAHVHGADRVVLVSADDRLCDVLARCKKPMPVRTVKKLKLEIGEKATGRNFSPTLFPEHVNLKSATNADLRAVLGQWPLPATKPAKAYRWLK